LGQKDGTMMCLHHGYAGTSTSACDVDTRFDELMAFKVTESNVTSNGVIAVTYERAGAITIGPL